MAAAAGIVFGGLVLWLRLSGRLVSSDFDQIWFAARALAHRRDPYSVVARRFSMPLYYPLPAAVVGLPFAALPITWAGPLFVGVGFALLGYALSSRGAWALLALVSLPALQAALQCQWSPVLGAAALLPWLGWLAVAKPTTGSTVAGAYFSRRWLWLNVTVGLALATAAFALWPGWVTEWLTALRGAHHFVPLVFRPGGVLLLLALLRWRLPEARLLALLAIMPQTGAAYDALPLALIPASRQEGLTLDVLSFATVPLLVSQEVPGDAFVQAMAHNQLVYLFALYLPALLMVLSRRVDSAVSRVHGA